MICSPEGRPEGHSDSRTVTNNTIREGAITMPSIFSCGGGCRCSDLAPLLQVENLVCVRYFSLTLADPSAHTPGRLVTDMVPRSRVTAAKLDEIGGEKLFNTALHSMNSSIIAYTPNGVRCKDSKPQAGPLTSTLNIPLSRETTTVPCSREQTDSIQSKVSQESALEALAAADREVKQVEAALDTAVGILVGQKRQEQALLTPGADKPSDNADLAKFVS